MTESYVTPTDGEHLRVSTSDGKYTVIQISDGSLRFLRHGVNWDAANHPQTGFRHVNIISALAYDLQEAREKIARLEEAEDQRLESIEERPE